MKRSDLRAFARRRWDVVGELKSSYWARVKRTTGVRSAVEAGEELRRQAMLLHRDWPAEMDRQQDMATHVRVAAALRRVAPTPAR